VIKLSRGVFPIHEIVTLQAILPQSPFVEIFVARSAGLRDSQERLTQILRLDVGSLGRRNLFRKMALVASQTGMLAFQQVSSFLVVEFVRIPLDQRKIGTIVIGVAAHAFLAGTGRNVIGAVQPLLRGHSRADIAMTADAFELRLPASNFVAIRAVQGTVKELMLAG